MCVNTFMYIVDLEIKQVSFSGCLFLFLDLKGQAYFVLSGVRLPSFIVSFTGKISLDNVFQERERLNHNIVGEEVF